MQSQALLVMLVEDHKADLESVIKHFYALGIIHDLNVTRALIKREFMRRQGLEESGRSIKMDLAVKYDCSLSHVDNCIYKHPEIRI